MAAKESLLHRGYSIEDLAENSDYLETCYSFGTNNYQRKSKSRQFVTNITRHTMVHESLAHFFDGFHHNAHPMAMMCGACGALSAFYHDVMDIRSERDREIAAHRLVAKMPTLAAMCYKHSIGQPFMYPRNDLSYAANFLYMMFGTPCETYVVSPAVEKAMDRIFLLHADHEQNASTSTVRLAGSSGANPFACISAGIAALWGPAHGGANEAVLMMLDEIGSVENIPMFIEKAKDPNDPFKLMGFGHRVYKNFDPRAKVMKVSCDEVLAELGVQDPRLAVAIELERIALSDPYFAERKLFPNVDFYSGIILERDWYSNQHVHRNLCGIKNHWLDYTLARNDFKPLQNWPPTPIISGRDTSEVSSQVNTAKPRLRSGLDLIIHGRIINCLKAPLLLIFIY